MQRRVGMPPATGGLAAGVSAGGRRRSTQRRQRGTERRGPSWRGRGIQPGPGFEPRRHLWAAGPTTESHLLETAALALSLVLETIALTSSTMTSIARIACPAQAATCSCSVGFWASGVNRSAGSGCSSGAGGGSLARSTARFAASWSSNHAIRTTPTTVGDNLQHRLHPPLLGWWGGECG